MKVEDNRCVYNDKDVFLWLPTSFNKSVCYEVLSFAWIVLLQFFFQLCMCTTFVYYSTQTSYVNVKISRNMYRGIAEIAMHGQAVNTSPFLSSHAAWIRGQGMRPSCHRFYKALEYTQRWFSNKQDQSLLKGNYAIERQQSTNLSP